MKWRADVKENVIQERSYAFALRVVKLYRWLCEEKKEYVLSKQILRCGTSVGANVEEAIGAQSEKDFHSKMTICLRSRVKLTIGYAFSTIRIILMIMLSVP